MLGRDDAIPARSSLIGERTRQDERVDPGGLRAARGVRPGGGRRRQPATAALAVLLAAAVAALLAAAFAGPAAGVGPGEVPDTGRSVIEVGGTALVRPGSVVDHVYVIGADAVIGGVVLRDVVCIGGDVLLLPTAVVQENVVCIGGRVDRHDDAVVRGDTTVISPGSLRAIAGWNPISPFGDSTSGSALLAWAVSALAHIALAAAVAAAAPRPVVAATARVRRRPWSSLGVGLLSGLVIVPLVSVVLLVSVVGLPLLVPWLLVAVPVALVVAFVAASTTAGDLAFRAARRPVASPRRAGGSRRPPAQPRAPGPLCRCDRVAGGLDDRVRRRERRGGRVGARAPRQKAFSNCSHDEPHVTRTATP